MSEYNEKNKSIMGGIYMTAKDIMSKEVITIVADTSIEEVARLLTTNNISGVPVLDEKSRVVGIVTQKDILYKDIEPHFPAYAEILGGFIYLGGVKHYNEELKKLVATKAEEIMTKNVITVYETEDIKEIAELMVKNNINRIPVLDEKGKLSGIISRADIVKYIADSV